jgi:hypothetical protein
MAVAMGRSEPSGRYGRPETRAIYDRLAQRRVRRPNPSSIAFVEWLQEYCKTPEVVLGYTSAEWEQSHNPYFAWKAIQYCTQRKIDFPDWVRDYLAECAQRMVSPSAAEASDVRKVLPRIMGFASKRGPGTPLRPEGKEDQYFDAALCFAREIAKGASPTVAIQTAFETLAPEVADKMDHRTLRSHIKKFFEATGSLRTWEDWRDAILAWGKRVRLLRQKFRETTPRK